MSESIVIENQPEPASWYSVPWVWLLLCIPFSAVLFGVVMIVSANYQPDDLVADDYYKAGKGINRRLELDANAASLNTVVALQAVTSEGAVFGVTGGGESLSLNVFHVSDSARDLTLTLQAVGGGIYTVQSRDLVGVLQTPGIWYIEVRDEANAWRRRARVVTPTQSFTWGEK